MKTRSWHVSSATTILVMVGIILFSAINAVFLSALLLIFVLPACLIWLGWTLHARKTLIDKIRKQQILEELRREGANV